MFASACLLIDKLHRPRESANLYHGRCEVIYISLKHCLKCPYYPMIARLSSACVRNLPRTIGLSRKGYITVKI